MPTSSTVSPPLPLSIAIVTKNEEHNLRRCLASVAGLWQELIIVDSGSTDGTKAVAEAHGASWYFQEWLGFRDQKNVALEYCRQPWVLALDADEALSTALREELLAFFASGAAASHAGASFPRKVWFLGRWITHGDWYPDRKLRLVRREQTRWSGSPEHDFLELPPGSLPERKMAADLLHFSFPNMSRYVQKINVFADVYLQRQITAGKTWSALGAISRSFWRFFRAYVLRAGFLDGFPGFWIAASTAYQTFIRHSRLFEHLQPTDPPETGNSVETVAQESSKKTTTPS